MLKPLYKHLSVLLLLVAGCAANPPANTYPELLLQRSHFILSGGFTLPDDQLGESSVNWSEGIIEVINESLYLTGNENEDAIAEFTVPVLRNTDSIDTWNEAGLVQPFVQVLRRLPANTDNLDQIVGLSLFGDQLFVNAVEYYDAPADNHLTTFVVKEASQIGRSQISAPYAMAGKARAAGWLSGVPAEWQRLFGCTHISGSSSGGPIISRYSVGPSAYCVDLRDISANPKKQKIQTQELLGFDESYPLHSDLFNESLSNNLWTHLSHATYGFIVPGTATYVTVGNSGGHRSGVKYKLEREPNDVCDGYCSVDQADQSSYYWLWDVRDLWRVSTGSKAASEIRPYEWGKWELPALSDTPLRIGGAAYNAANNTLYMSVLDARSNIEKGTNPPVIVGYHINKPVRG